MHAPSFSSFVTNLSTLASTGEMTQEVLNQVVRSLARELAPSRVCIHLLDVEVQNAPPRKTRFEFSRRIAVRRVDYGYLSVQVDTPAGSPAEWMYALEILAQQLAMYAERLTLIERGRRLSEEKRQAQEALQTDKALARASGIVADLAKISTEQAKSTILREAVKRGKTPLAVAEQLILEKETFRTTVAA
jgi:hypothetical protein